MLFRRKFLNKQASKDQVKFFVENDDLTPISKRSNTSLSISSATNSRTANGYAHRDNAVKSFASLKTSDSEAANELGFAGNDNYAKLNVSSHTDHGKYFGTGFLAF